MVRTWLVRGLLTLVVAGLAGACAFLWQDRLDLAEKNSARVQDFYRQLSASQVAFTDSGDLVFPDEQKFNDRKTDLLQKKASFIEMNLRTMRGGIYSDGIRTKDFAILAKGREGSWWETPTGSYEVATKERNHFSSIAKVWMPYSVQFYGNFFIHGWPYYPNGKPIPSHYSGSLGCIRLGDDDAKAVYEFAKAGMPVLVFEDEPLKSYGRITQKIGADALAPAIEADSFLVADLTTGEPLLKKEPGKVVELGSLAKIMDALVASELIHFDKEIKIVPSMLASLAQVFAPNVGDRYSAFELMYPLLTQSSSEAAGALAGFLGESNFLNELNRKAESLGMTETRFADLKGGDSRTVSTAKDLLRMLQYIYYKRDFIFELTKGNKYLGIDGGPLAGLSNYNDFYQDEKLVATFGGKTVLGRDNSATVWQMPGKAGAPPVAVILFGAGDKAKDAKVLIDWVYANFEVKQ